MRPRSMQQGVAMLAGWAAQSPLQLVSSFDTAQSNHRRICKQMSMIVAIKLYSQKQALGLRLELAEPWFSVSKGQTACK